MAEVLITLGIIGVVAAMTLPTLVQNYKKHVTETRLARFYSSMKHAIQRSEVDNGEMKYWDSIYDTKGFEKDSEGNIDYNSPKFLPWFNKYLRPYLSIIRVENPKQYEGKIAVYFSDGSVALMAYPTCHYYIDAKDFEMITNEDGILADNREKFAGTKVFTFSMAFNSNFRTHRKGFEPWGVEGVTSPNIALQDCKPEITGERAYCAAVIQKNGWKIPKDYPLKF